MFLRNLLLSTAILSIPAAFAGTTEVVIRADRPGAQIQPTMYGLFFEDINYAADGGLYAEMVKNRSFEFPQSLMGWESFGNIDVLADGPFVRNPHYVRMSSAGHPHRATGLSNSGFFGMAFKEGEKYRFSLWAKAPAGSSALLVELVDPASMGETQVMASGNIKVESGEWKQYEIILTPEKTVKKGALRLFLDSDCGCDVEHVSLFPTDTWNGHRNGLRKDLAQKLADINPGLLRFPGGCIVEGTDIDTRYQWKNSVGPVENRPLNANRWQHTFHHRFFPDYYQSYGLGFYEYFLLAEEIGAAPLPVLNVGLACQYQNDDMSAHIPADSLHQYIDDALDLIEFANGSAETEWGRLRAEMGHPMPFGLRHIAIGNEQWGPEYVERLEPFVKAIREAHPEIMIVGSSGPSASGSKFDYLWPEMKKLGVDLVDEHYYCPEDFFLTQADRYDSYDRKGPKVFAGEYACHGRGKKYNHFNAALMEAALMTGLERNADVVHMATYAPLFAHVEGWQWRPDMIWFDNMNSVATSSYYVQQMFASNRGTRVLPLTIGGRAATGAEGQEGLYASAAIGNDGEGYIVKIVNTSDAPRQLSIRFDGLKKGHTISSVTATTLSSDDPDADNTIDNPTLITPLRSGTGSIAGNTVSLTIPAATFGVYDVR